MIDHPKVIYWYERQATKCVILFYNIFSLKAVGKIFGLDSSPYFLLLLFSFIICIVLLFKEKLYLQPRNWIYILSLLSLIIYVCLQVNSTKSLLTFLEFIFLPISLFCGIVVSLRLQCYRFRLELLVCLIFALILITNRGLIYAGGQNYLLISNVILIGFIIASFSGYRKLIIIFLQIIFIISCLFVQARFSILFAVTFFCFYWLSSKNLFIKFFMFLLIFTLSLQSLYFLELMQGFEGVSRLISHGIFSNSRILLLEQYFSKIDQFWFTGLGLGQSQGLFTGYREAYIHNFALELISEFGVLSVPLLLAVFAAVAYGARNYFPLRKRFKYFPTMFWLFIYFVLTFSKSFSVYDSYIMFFYGGLILGAYGRSLSTDWK